MVDKQIIELSAQLGKMLKEKGLKLVTAESCTGGGIAQAITEIPGSSAWFDRGFVTYSNSAKVQMLKVKQLTLDQYGAVSEEVAIQMVEGALVNSDANIAVAVTGIAGPSGGTELKPIGTVFIAWGVKEGLIFCSQSIFSGNRTTIRKATVISALKSCIQQAKLENKISLTLYQKSEIYLKQLLKDKLPQNTQIFLFGSRAKGTAGGMADIDIGILSESVVAKKILNDIKETIEQSFVPYDVDLVDFNAVSEAFKQQAMKKVISWS